MSKSLWDVVVCAAIAAAAGVVHWEAAKLKPGTYDPLGSGTMPRMVAVAIFVLCAWAAIQSILEWRARRAPAPAPEEDFVRRPWLAATLFVYCIGAAAMMQLQVPFGVTSTLFLFVSILTIKRCERAIILPAALCSSALGFGLTYFFGTLFGVDLP